MSGFLNIKKIFMPFRCLSAAYGHMREAGLQHVEAVALFAGRGENDLFYIERVIVPRQKTYRMEEGLLYSVDGEELHRINVWLYEHKMELIAQIHSHPGEAYHSETDDAYPIVATLGGVSIVAPDFASGEIDLGNCAAYRLVGERCWEPLKKNEKESFIEITY